MTTTTTVSAQNDDHLICDLSSPDGVISAMMDRIGERADDDPIRYECEALLFDSLARLARDKAGTLRDALPDEEQVAS